MSAGEFCCETGGSAKSQLDRDKEVVDMEVEAVVVVTERLKATEQLGDDGVEIDGSHKSLSTTVAVFDTT